MTGRMMSLRIKGGTNPFHLTVEDMDTGMLLPAVDVAFRYDARDGALLVNVTLDITEIDIVVDDAAVRADPWRALVAGYRLPEGHPSAKARAG